MKRATKIFSAVTLVLIAGSIAAQPAEQRYDRVDFSVTAEREVPNDIMIAVVFAEAEDNDQEDAADEVNRAISWAADQARDASDIDLQTMRYTTRPVYAPNSRRIVGWIARQSLRLESEDAESLSSLLGDLQARVAIESLSYSLSKAARDAAEDELIAEALARFDRRAGLVASEMGREGFRIISINVNSSGAVAFGRMQRDSFVAFAEAQVAAPEIEAGEQILAVSVNGAIELAAAP